MEPIFHQKANPFTLGLHMGYSLRREQLALPIPTYWYLKSLANPKRPLTQAYNAQCKPILPKVIPNMSNWNMVLVWQFCVGIMLVMFISCCLCPVPSCWVANENALSGGIQATEMRSMLGMSILCLAPFFRFGYLILWWNMG